MMDKQNTGILLNKEDIQIHRQYFKEMVELIGINVIYRTPLKGTKYNSYGEFDNYFSEPVLVGCIFEEHPNQWTMKKLGWVSELQDNFSIIHVPYDLTNLQAGCIFIIPSGVDNAKGRVFRVTRMSTTMVYPASISCELVPEYENISQKSETHDFTTTDFNLLKEEKDIND